MPRANARTVNLLTPVSNTSRTISGPMVIPESSFGLRCEAWHTGNSDGSRHAVLLSSPDVHGVIKNVAGFDTEHLRPLVIAEVWQGPRPLHPRVPHNRGKRIFFRDVNTAT